MGDLNGKYYCSIWQLFSLTQTASSIKLIECGLCHSIIFNYEMLSSPLPNKKASASNLLPLSCQQTALTVITGHTCNLSCAVFHSDVFTQASSCGSVFLRLSSTEPSPPRHVECWSPGPPCFLEAAATHQELLVEKVQAPVVTHPQRTCSFYAIYQKLLDFIPRQF